MLAELELATDLQTRLENVDAAGRELGQALCARGAALDFDAGENLTLRLSGSWVYLEQGYLQASRSGETLAIVSPKSFFRVAKNSLDQGMELISDFTSRVMVWSEEDLVRVLSAEQDLLRRFLHFQGLYVDTLEAICGSLAGGEIRPPLHFSVYQVGDVILEEGTEATTVGVLSRGHAVVKVKGAVVGEIGAGEMFGEMSFLTGQTRAASVEATQLCECQFTTHRDFARLIRCRPSLMIEVAGQLARRISELGSRYADS